MDDQQYQAELDAAAEANMQAEAEAAEAAEAVTDLERICEIARMGGCECRPFNDDGPLSEEEQERNYKEALPAFEAKLKAWRDLQIKRKEDEGDRNKTTSN